MLTERIIRDAKPEPKARILWDSQVSGLGCKVFPSGRKTFVLSYRVAGRKRLATLARCGEISLSAVRDKAGAELVGIRDGDSDPLERRREAKEAPTVADALDRFFDEFAPARIEAGRLTEKTVSDYRKQARRYVRPSLGDRPIAKVTRRDVERMADRMASVPAQRNRTLAFLSRIFTLAEHWEWRDQRTNPVRGVTRAKEQARDRVLAHSEMAALGEALDAMEADHPFTVAAIRTAAMTGLRISECLAMAWDDVDAETARVVLPRTKTGRRVVPLAAPVLQLVRSLPRINGNPWVFAGARGSALTYRTVRLRFAKACERAGLADVRMHDLRRSVATNLAASGVGVYTLPDVLGHSTLAMSNRYVRMAGDELTEATERAAAMAAATMSGRKAEIVPLNQGRGA